MDVLLVFHRTRLSQPHPPFYTLTVNNKLHLIIVVVDSPFSPFILHFLTLNAIHEDYPVYQFVKWVTEWY